MSNTEIRKTEDADLTLMDILNWLKKWWFYYITKWLIIVTLGLVGGLAGVLYAIKQQPEYIARLSFALEEEKSGGGLGGALGLASSLGFDLGTNAGGAFAGANLIELMKSRTLVEKALLNPITVNNKEESLISYYIKFNKLNADWHEKPELKSIDFAPNADRSKFNYYQDSILGVLYLELAGPEKPIYTVAQKDKKVSILTIVVKSTNELFAKSFTEAIAKEVSAFYIETKSKKAKNNVMILEKQVDSIRSELNSAITGVAVASDNTYNLNPALNIKRTPSTKRQVDVQANTAILTQLVVNLEMAKVTLLKETPLIQVIDKPILPLEKKKLGKKKALIVGGLLGGFISLFLLMLWKIWKDFKNKKNGSSYSLAG
ncbi:hypothetical protein [Sediminibacterium sp.]|uniref:hypothetical protein n=1 Tax=Sediminibacterium sp. TaxID=1917865 RepID=UPI0025D5695B|nr:hypothetical protein [Sediminibacterium sp.]MBW0177648.1 hypothetical protein [Sediminibacterium sp.]